MNQIDPNAAKLAENGVVVPLEGVKLYDQDAPEVTEGPIEFTIVEQTGPDGESIATGPNGTEVLPAVKVETIDASPRPKRLLSGMRKLLGKGDKSPIAAADEAKDESEQDAPQEENAFTKFTKESQEKRAAESFKSRRAARKEARAEKREKRNEAMLASIDDQGNALPKAPKAKGESRLGAKMRSLRSRPDTTSSKIAALEAELDGASSTIATMKKDASGNKVYQKVHSNRTYAVNEQGKKVRMTNADLDAYEQKVAQLNELREGAKPKTAEAKEPTEKLAKVELTKGDFNDFLDESELPKHEVAQFFSTASVYEVEKVKNLSPEDRDVYMINWHNANPRTDENGAMNTVVVNEFLDGLTDDEYDDFSNLSVEEQNDWIKDWFADEKGDSQTSLNVVYKNRVGARSAQLAALSAKKANIEMLKQDAKANKQPGKLRSAVLAAVVGTQTATAEHAANTREKMTGKKKAVIAGAIGAVAAVGVGAYLANRYGIGGGGSRSAAEGSVTGGSGSGIDREHAGLIAANKAEKAANNAAALAEFRRSERAAEALLKVKEELGISTEGISKAQNLADKGKYSWSVANALSPGKESTAMQIGIDKFNELAGSDFSLQTKNGVLQIVRGNGKVVNPTEMAYINQLMINELS